MNKLGVAIALVAVFAAIASANRVSRIRHQHQHILDDEFEPEHGHSHNRCNSCHHQHDSDFDLDNGHHHHHQNRNHEHELEHGHGHGSPSQGHTKSHLLKKKLAAKKNLLRGSFNHHGDLHHGVSHGSIKGGIRRGGHRHGGHRHGGVVGAGGFGHGRSESELDAGFHSNTRLGSHKGVEGHKSFLAGENRDVHVGNNHHDSNNNEEIHRHKVLNKDRLVVSEKDRGHEDVDEIRNNNDHSSSNHFGASDSKFIGAQAGGSAHSDREFEKDIEAGVHAEKSNEGSAGFGIGGAKF